MEFLILMIFCSILTLGCCHDDVRPHAIIPLHDIRVVRDHSNSSSITNLVTEDPFRHSNASQGFAWIGDAVKDIAYYLRAHKFNEYDRRYETNPTTAPRDYFGAFPRPPLRSLHWEVRKFCEPSFLSCAGYLRKQIAETGLRRVDDTSVVVQEQHWSDAENLEQIRQVNTECLNMSKSDDSRADPFQGPIERYQWRVTASYYMCWYAMNETPDLKHIKENCDNFARCVDETYGVNNLDPRARDEEPFACAIYSFCPDPCCPKSKHIADPSECLGSPENPCYEINPVGKRDCSLRRSENRNFHDLILNRWNVTCRCPKKGFEWSSRYGICVDVDECVGEKHGCESDREICVNMPGSFFCACRWGFAWNGKACMPHGAIETIRLERKKDEKSQKENETGRSLIGILVGKIRRLYGKTSKGCKSFFINPLLTITSIIYSSLS